MRRRSRHASRIAFAAALVFALGTASVAACSGSAPDGLGMGAPPVGPTGAPFDAGATPDATRAPDAAPADAARDAAIAPTDAASTDARPGRAAALEAFVQAEMARHHRDGIGLAIVKNGKTVYERGFGVADVAHQVPVGSDTIFLVASMSKPVMVTAVMQVAEKVARERGTTVAALLDADVDTLLRRGPSDPLSVRHPGYPGTPISLRMLLSHVSGISVDYDLVPHHIDVFPPSFTTDAMPDLRTAHAEYLRPDGSYFSWDNFVDASPGTAYEYSSIASSIASHFVEAATGVPFPEYCRVNVFGPLGMLDTAWRIADMPNVVQHPQRLATPYYYDEDAGKSVVVTPSAYWEDVFYPAASLRTTAGDYAKLVGALMNETSGILSPESIRELGRVQYKPLESTQGLILYYMKRGGFWVLGHEGYNDGFLSSSFFMVPTEKLPDAAAPGDLWGGVILTNGEWDAPTGDGLLKSIGGEILRAGLAGELD